MRTNHGESARHSCPLALDSIGIKQRAVVVRSLKHLGFLFHDAHVGIRNSEAILSVIVGDAFQKRLAGAE